MEWTSTESDTIVNAQKLSIKKKKMNEKQANILRSELDNPPIYNMQPINIDVESEIRARTKKSNWLIEFEALCTQNRFKSQSRWWQFWRHWY